MTEHSVAANTFYQEVDRLKENFKKVNDACPATYLAAENLRSLWERVISRCLRFDGKVQWQYASSAMILGAFQSWVVSYIMTSGGFHDIGLMSMRRAIEFACYLAKVGKSDERAKLWLDKFESLDARKEFSSIFAIPRSYMNEKYAHLRPLLINYDYTSDFGTHGNFEVLAAKIQSEKKSSKIYLTLQDSGDNISISLGVVLLTGYRMILSILDSLRQTSEIPEEIENQRQSLTSMVHTARINSAILAHRGNPPKEILDAINTDDDSYVRETFAEMAAKYK